MNDFRPGQMAVLSEDGGRKLVRVVANASTADQHRYLLRVLENIHNTSLNPKMRIGSEFEVMQVKTGGWGGMWNLESLEEYRVRHPEYMPAKEPQP